MTHILLDIKIIIFNVAKYNLGKVKLELMQSVVAPFTVHDLRGGPLEICKAFVSCCLSHAVMLVDLGGSIALCQQILVDSRTVFVDSHTRNTMHTKNTLNRPSAAYIRCFVSAGVRGNSSAIGFSTIRV